MKPQSYYDNLTIKQLPTKTDKLFSITGIIFYISICLWMGSLV